MIDIHCHLNFKAFENDFNEVIKRASEKGVKKIVNVGAALDSSKRAVELAEKYNPPAGGLYATVGIHPHHADKLEPDWEQRLEDIVLQSRISLRETKHPKVVAIGECGMDFYRYQSNDIVDPKLQEKLFIKHIELSSKLHLPLQIHNRQAGKEIIEILLNHKSYLLNPPGVFHCFSGDIELLKSALQIGFYIGFDGNITYKGLAKGETTALSELVKFTPLDRILVETDSPYLTPEPQRGSRNEPSYVILVAKAISQIKNVSFEEIDNKTTENAKTLFSI
ncbi:MAG: TatD family hydrolase [Candidatus Levyibacteriota bacterium]